MPVYYRVSLENGIEVEKRPYRFYSGSPELGKTVFRGLRDAKRAFEAVTSAEIGRIKALRERYKPIQTQRDMVALAGVDEGETADGEG